jgi:hypothetical protein
MVFGLMPTSGAAGIMAVLRRASMSGGSSAVSPDNLEQVFGDSKNISGVFEMGDWNSKGSDSSSVITPLVKGRYAKHKEHWNRILN